MDSGLRAGYEGHIGVGPKTEVGFGGQRLLQAGIKIAMVWTAGT